MLCRGQVITAGMEGHIIDISIPAVCMVMDILKVKDREGCLSGVKKLFHATLKQRRG